MVSPLGIITAVTVAVAAAVAVRLARAIALKRALLDVPNERSSHKVPVPRLGGAAFVPVVLGGVAFGWVGPGLPTTVKVAVLAGAVALFAISLLDDFRSLSTTVRFIVQFSAAFGVLGAMCATGFELRIPREGVQTNAVFVAGSSGLQSVSDGGIHIPESLSGQSQVADRRNQLVSEHGPEANSRALASVAFRSSDASGFRPFGVLVGLLCALWIVALLNIYNFMDGIDGIAGIQAVAAGVTWSVLAMASGASQSALLGTAAAAGALGFLSLNWPPARIFMGDAGSTVLGYVFAVLPLLVILETNTDQPLRYLGAGVLVVWPFIADGTFTILRRLRRGENILKAHRSHLYQRLVIAGISHRAVTCVYGLLASLGGVLSWLIVEGMPYALAITGPIVGAAFCALLGVVAHAEERARKRC